ncbi:hypothetical protein yrohd0001_34570 [Yersinia rohdei ATCC 43380]|nr:hypothetical protein yrohd0001_34570 [Yersinia rohdei ATCC 43380]
MIANPFSLLPETGGATALMGSPAAHTASLHPLPFPTQ